MTPMATTRRESDSLEREKVRVSLVEKNFDSNRPLKRERSKVTANGMTYADWLTRAIESTPDARLTLAEIYDWMVSNVPGLSGQRYLHSSKGWKNAVRHTLSVNARFCKLARPSRPSFWALASSSTNTTPSNSAPASISDAQTNLAIRNRRKRTRDDSVTPLTIDEIPKRSRTISSPSIVSSVSLSPQSSKSTPSESSEITAPYYMIDYYQIPLALAAVAATVGLVFSPKPTIEFRASPTSAFVSFRPRQEAMG